MGGTDLGVSLSTSSSATSGLQKGATLTYGDMIAGGKKVPIWIPLAIIVGLFGGFVIWILSKKD